VPVAPNDIGAIVREENTPNPRVSFCREGDRAQCVHFQFDNLGIVGYIPKGFLENRSLDKDLTVGVVSIQLDNGFYGDNYIVEREFDLLVGRSDRELETLVMRLNYQFVVLLGTTEKLVQGIHIHAIDAMVCGDLIVLNAPVDDTDVLGVDTRHLHLASIEVDINVHGQVLDDIDHLLDDFGGKGCVDHFCAMERELDCCGDSRDDSR
jgi:hypothetical protein